jgi:hypothetical protein
MQKQPQTPCTRYNSSRSEIVSSLDHRGIANALYARGSGVYNRVPEIFVHSCESLWNESSEVIQDELF